MERDEKLIVGVGGMKPESWQPDNRNSNNEGSLFVSRNQFEALLKFI